MRESTLYTESINLHQPSHGRSVDEKRGLWTYLESRITRPNVFFNFFTILVKMKSRSHLDLRGHSDILWYLPSSLAFSPWERENSYLLIVDIYSVKFHLFIETSVIRVSIPFRSDCFTVKPGGLNISQASEKRTTTMKRKEGKVTMVHPKEPWIVQQQSHSSWSVKCMLFSPFLVSFHHMRD